MNVLELRRLLDKAPMYAIVTLPGGKYGDEHVAVDQISVTKDREYLVIDPSVLDTYDGEVIINDGETILYSRHEERKRNRAERGLSNVKESIEDTGHSNPEGI